MQKPQKLSKLEEVFRKKKEHNHKYKDKINEATLAYQNFATEVKNQIASHDENYSKLTTQLSKHREVNQRESTGARRSSGYLKMTLAC